MRDKMPGHFDRDGCVFPDWGHFVHEPVEDVDDYSMCECGVPVGDHEVGGIGGRDA